MIGDRSLLLCLAGARQRRSCDRRQDLLAHPRLAGVLRFVDVIWRADTLLTSRFAIASELGFERENFMLRFAVCLASCCWLSSWASVSAEETPVKWERIKLEEIFRAEGVAVADINKDGRMDLINGEAWYEQPSDPKLFLSGNWTMHPLRAEGIRRYIADGAYSNNFALWTYDISGDGWQDVIVIGFPGVPCHWFENPQGKPGPWAQYEIWHSAANETPQFQDITGDGKPELIMSSETEQMIGYLEIPSPDQAKKKWNFTQVNGEKLGPQLGHRYYHGLGVGDVNKDGRNDIVIPHGWWEQPAKLNDGPWTFHKHVLKGNGEGNPETAADIYVDDLDGDGDNDILMSAAHHIGVWWFENVGSSADPKFKQHVIDDKFSQTHALHYQDVNGDGVKDLITGKRFYAHGSGGDPDAKGEVVMFWYEIKKTAGQPPQFTKHKIEAGTDTGIGTQFFVGDFDGDKLLDIVLSNKKGTNVLLQRR